MTPSLRAEYAFNVYAQRIGPVKRNFLKPAGLHEPARCARGILPTAEAICGSAAE